MKIKEQTRKLAQVAQSTALRLQIKLTWFEEIFEEYYFANPSAILSRLYFIML